MQEHKEWQHTQISHPPPAEHSGLQWCQHDGTHLSAAGPGSASAGTQEGSGPTIVLNSLPCQPVCVLLKSGSTSCCVRFGEGGILCFKCVDWNFWHSKFSSHAKQPARIWELLVPPRLLAGLHGPAQQTAAVLGGAELHYSTAADPINTAASSDRAEPQPGDSSFLAVLLADVPTHTATHQQATAISTAAL